MLYRFNYLQKDLSLDNSGEKTVDIRSRSPITALWVELRADNGASYNHHNPVHDCVTDIEIIDGANVIYSLNGYQALALTCANLGHMPNQKFSALGGDPQSLNIPIMFGRYLGDKEYALDPTKFVNPQLRIKWDLATTNAVGATGFADGGATLTVIAEVMEDAPAPRALLMSKEHYTWTSAVGTEYIDLPTDYPYKGLFFRGFLNAYHPYGVISNLKINCDGGAYVPMDVGVEDLLYLMMLRQPRLSYRISDHLQNDDTFYSYLKELEDVMMISEQEPDYVMSYINYEYGSQTVYVYNAGTPRVGYVNIGAHVHGYCPFGYIYVPFGDPKDRSDWFPAQNFDSIRLEALGVVAAGSCAVGVVQERPY